MRLNAPQLTLFNHWTQLGYEILFAGLTSAILVTGAGSISVPAQMWAMWIARPQDDRVANVKYFHRYSQLYFYAYMHSGGSNIPEFCLWKYIVPRLWFQYLTTAACFFFIRIFLAVTWLYNIQLHGWNFLTRTICFTWIICENCLYHNFASRSCDVKVR